MSADGPSRQILQRKRMSAAEGSAEVAGPRHRVWIPLRIWDAALPKTRRQKTPPETGGANDPFVTRFETQRSIHLLRMPRSRGHFEHSSAIS
jgi:hypothetical protein